jgi:transposase
LKLKNDGHPISGNGKSGNKVVELKLKKNDPAKGPNAHKCSLMHKNPEIFTIVDRDGRKVELRVPIGEQIRIVQASLAGMNASQIARMFCRNRRTVTRIIRAPQVQEQLQRLKESLLGYSDRWVDSINYRIDNETDGEMAFRLLERFDVIPPKKNRNIMQQQPRFQMSEQDLYESYKKRAAMQLGMMALERHEVYGSALPEGTTELADLVKKALSFPAGEKNR